jgi:hypothetical protein
MARKRASQQVDGGRHGSGPDDGPEFEVEAVLAAARAEIGGLGKGARRRLARVERKLGMALRVEAKRRRKLGEALGEVAGLVARVREIVQPGEAGEPTAPDASVEETGEKKARKRTSVKATAARKATMEPAPKSGAQPTPGPKPTASASPAQKAGPKRTASPKPTASPSPAPKRRTARRRPGPDAGSTS